MKKVIIITGPGGSGKTTIAKLIENECGYILIDGDQEDTEFFPNGGQWLPENSDKLHQAHDKILNKTTVLIKEGKQVIIDYIVFGHYLEFFNKFAEAFGNDLQIIVLYPEQAETITRDKERYCWTTGVDRIAAVYCEFEKIKDQLGKDKFIDTSGKTPEETFNMIRNDL